MKRSDTWSDEWKNHTFFLAKKIDAPSDRALFSYFCFWNMSGRDRCSRACNPCTYMQCMPMNFLKKWDVFQSLSGNHSWQIQKSTYCQTVKVNPTVFQPQSAPRPWDNHCLCIKYNYAVWYFSSDRHGFCLLSNWHHTQSGLLMFS